MLKINKKGIIYQLNSLLYKINDYKDNSNLIPEFTIEFIQSLQGKSVTYIMAPSVGIPNLAANAIAFCSA